MLLPLDEAAVAAVSRGLLAALALAAAPACAGDDGEGPAADRCPTWPSGTDRAGGTLDVQTAGGSSPPAGELLLGVEVARTASEDLITIRACTVAFVDEAPWEPWGFIATYRLAGPVDAPTTIPGATLVGTPGMSGGLATRSLACETGCQPEVTDSWLFQRSGAAEITVERYALRALASSGWVLTDDNPGRRVDLELDLTW